MQNLLENIKKYKSNNSLILSVIYSIIIFGPHRLFGFNYIQETCFIFIAFLNVKSGNLSKKLVNAVTLFSFYCILKFAQIIIVDNYDYLFILSIVKFFIALFAVDFLIKEKISKKADILACLLIFSLFNSISVFAQFFSPDIRLFFSSGIREIRYQGFAWDGYQITTLISSVIIIILFETILKIKNKNISSYFCFSLLFILYTSLIIFGWLFQGRLSQLISLSLISFYIPYKFFYFNKNGINIQTSNLKFILSFIFSSTLVLTLVYALFYSNINEILNEPAFKYGLEIYRKGFSDTSTFQDININHLSILDYFSSLNQWLWGTVSSGRGSRIDSFNVKSVLFDNGYMLDIYSFGIIGSSLIYCLSIYLIGNFRKQSKYFYILLLILLIGHFKESTFLSGSSYFALALMTKFDK